MAQTIVGTSIIKQRLLPFCCARYLSNFSVIKDVTINKQPTNLNNQDLLMQNLKNCMRTESLLKLVSQHAKIMNNNHFLQALRSIFTLQKHAHSDLSAKQLVKHDDFIKLCNKIKSQAGAMDLNDVIEALKVVCFLGVPSNSGIVQVLLQLVRHNVNELSLQQINFLSFLLKQFDGNTPLIDALNIALPLVFEVQITIKMDRQSINHIAECLHYVTKHRVSNKCTETIVAAALRFDGEIDVKTATSIVWSLCDLKPDLYYEPLLNKAINVMNVSLDQLEYNEMETSLTKLINKYSKRFPFYFNETFFDLCSNYVIEKQLGAEIALYVCRKFTKVGYVNNYLIDYISDEIVNKKPGLLLEGDPIFALILVLHLATTDYKPKEWNVLKSLLESTTLLTSSIKPNFLLLKLATSLMALDIYKPEVLRATLDEKFLSKILKNIKASDKENIILLTAAVKVMHPEFSKFLPSNEAIDLNSENFPVDYPLEGALEKCLGGKQYVKTGVNSDLGLHIDHIIAMRPGGYPVAINNIKSDNDLLENIQIPTDSQLISILAMPSYYYTLNGKRMKETASLLLRILETQGCSVVPICLDEWENLPDFERLPYLMQRIKSKTEANQALNSVV